MRGGRMALAVMSAVVQVTEAGVEWGGGDGHCSGQYEMRAEVTEKVTMGRGSWRRRALRTLNLRRGGC